MWDELFTLDEAWQLYSFATSYVIVEENLKDPQISAVMKATFGVACNLAWDLVISRRRFNSQIAAMPLPWLGSKAFLRAEPLKAFQEIRTVDNDCFDEEADDYPGGIENVIVTQSGQRSRQKRARELALHTIGLPVLRVLCLSLGALCRFSSSIL